jgi:hypothetical protein
MSIEARDDTSYRAAMKALEVAAHAAVRAALRHHAAPVEPLRRLAADIDCLSDHGCTVADLDTRLSTVNMGTDTLHRLRATIAADFELVNDACLGPVAMLTVVNYGGTLIGPEDPGGPAEYQIELLGVTGFGESIAAAARQWALNVARMCDPETALEDSE